MPRKLIANVTFQAVLLMMLSFGLLAQDVEQGEAQDPQWLIATEYFPPYSYLENDYVAGIAVDYAQELLGLAEIPFDTQILPWARVVEYLDTRPNTLTPTMAQTDERLDKYLWLGPFDAIKIFAWELSGEDVRQKNPSKQIVSVIRGSAAEDHLLNELNIAPQKLLLVNGLRQMVGLLAKDRVDVIYVAENMDEQVLELADQFPDSNISKGDLLLELPLYIAINKSSDVMQIASLQKAAQQILMARKD